MVVSSAINGVSFRAVSLGATAEISTMFCGSSGGSSSSSSSSSSREIVAGWNDPTSTYVLFIL